MITKKDIGVLIGIIKVNYPHTYKNFTENDFKILVESWYDDLKDYKKDLVFFCFNEAKKVNSISVTTADIIKQIEKIKQSLEPSKDELWCELLRILPLAERIYDNRMKSIWDKGGMWYCNNYEREKDLPPVFDNLHDILKTFLVSWESLGKIAMLYDDDLKFEKARFMREFDSLKERVKYRASCERFTGLVQKANIKRITEN